MGRRPVRALSALVLVSTILAAGGAASAVAAEGLLTESGRAAYLEARGIDPAEAIVQVGPRLYAGPVAGCPAGFACVDPAGAPVLQVVTADARGPGIALAKCSGTGGVTSVATGNDCTVSQVVPASSAPADLTASCTHGSAEAPISNPAATSALQRTCTIEQDNQAGGNNTATARIFLDQRNLRNGGATYATDQRAVATADIAQTTSGAGDNTATVHLSTDQRSDGKNIAGAVTNVQEGRVATSLEQSGDADNTGTITHRILQKADARFSVVGPIVQRQNALDDGAPDSYAFVRQFSTSGDPAVGFNNLTLDMNETLRADGFSSSSKNVTLLQGAPSGGLIGDIDGDADGVPPQGSSISTAPGSSFRATLSKEFRQDARSGAGATLTLVEDDVVDCCDLPLGFSDSYDFCTLDFDALMAQSPFRSQKITMRGTAEVDRGCTASFDGTTNQSSFSEQASGERIVFSAECQNANCTTNDAPAAQDVAVSGQEDTVITWTPVVSDPENGTMTCQEWVDDPPVAQHGTVHVDPNCGPSTYTPDPDFSGTDTFRYVGRDPGGLFSNRATVTVTVTPVNDAPVAQDDAAATDEDVPVTINVAANDHDIDDGLNLASVSVVSGPSHGNAVAHQNGTVTYTPVLDYDGTDSFVYGICDHGGLCDTATVTVTIHNVPTPPRSSLVLGVRNERQGGSFGTSTNLGVAPDNRAQYKITYRNDGEASATGVIVRHPIPNQASLVSGSCSPSCTVQGGQVVFDLGARPTGATDLFFTLAYNVSFQDTTTQATGQSIEEGAFTPSNPVVVRNICISTPTSPLCDPF